MPSVFFLFFFKFEFNSQADVLALGLMKNNNKIKNKIRRFILNLTYFLSEVTHILRRI